VDFLDLVAIADAVDIQDLVDIVGKADSQVLEEHKVKVDLVADLGKADIADLADIVDIVE
jgi:hypothetical protein